MDQAILHFLIPVVIIRIINLLKKNKFDKKLIFLLSPLAVIPDIDFFIFYHRATFHNVFFGILLVAIAVLVLRKHFKTSHIILLGSFFFLMHAVLDTGEVIWFYPLTDTGYGFTGNKVTLEQLQVLPQFPASFLFFSAWEVAIILALMLIEISLEKRRKKSAKK